MKNIFAFLILCALLASSSAFAAAKGGESASAPAPTPSLPSMPSPSTVAPQAMPGSYGAQIGKAKKNKASFFGKNCLATLMQNLEVLGSATPRAKGKPAALPTLEEKTDAQAKDAIRTIHQQLLRFASPFAFGEQSYPESIENEGGTELVANSYNQFSAASREMESDFSAGTRLQALNKKCSTEGSLGGLTWEGSGLEDEVNLTRRFLLVRHQLTKVAMAAIEASHKTAADATSLQKRTTELLQEKIAMVEKDINDCPLRVWSMAKLRIAIHRGTPEGEIARCTVEEFAEHKLLLEKSFDKLIHALRLHGEASKPTKRKFHSDDDDPKPLDPAALGEVMEKDPSTGPAP